MDPRQSYPSSSSNPSADHGPPPYPPHSTAPSPYHQAARPPHPHPHPHPHSHQRRPSDTPYYPSSSSASRSFAPDAGHAGHARAQSTSSIPSAWELGRTMPPPNSPPGAGSQQPPPPPQQQAHGGIMTYGPPPPRPPPVAVGPPSSFPSGRELPALSSITRTGSAGGNSSMSISSMLGGPPPASRDSQPPPQHYSPHSAATGPTSGPGYAPSIHASPRMPSASSEYPPFRRPHTPDHQRPYDPRGSAAPSPHGPYSTTPDVQRYGTPQAYHSRHPSASGDPSRDPGRMSAGPPPTPGSQPKPYDPYGRREEVARPASAMEYNPERTGLRPHPFDDRYRPERDRQTGLEHREREGRERAYSGGDANRHHMNSLGHREPPREQPPYGRPPDRRDPRDSQWGRQGPENSYRAPMDQRPDYPPSSGPYPPHSGPGYQTAPPERYPPASHPPHGQGHPAPSYESPERPRLDHHPQAPRLRPEEGPPPGYNGGHGPSPFDPSRPRHEDPPGGTPHQRNIIALQEINRKGRVSPLPQAVQGAQPQQPGPAAEPSIKSEFGRMFAGIGSGVSGIGVSSPVTSAPAIPFTNPGLPRREEEGAGTDSGPDVNGKTVKGRRRKLKDESGLVDDDSSGRLTPSGRGNKRSRGHQHHHHHHHHHHHTPDGVSSPAGGVAAVKKSSTPLPGDKSAGATHHHHHHHTQRPNQAQPKAPTPPPVIPPKPKTSISSKAVLDSVADRPRHHLGDFIYEPGLKAGRLLPNNPTHRGFSSNPRPLPWDVIKGKENCTLTVKVPHVHLTAVAREEITSRGYIWGTDVYTDDSDVVAACIHGGWIKGEWTEDVDTAMLDLDPPSDVKRRKTKSQPVEVADADPEGLVTKPPPSGPMTVPADRDLHVNVIILPRLVKYSAITRFGITSREFGGEFGARHVVHDGISFKVKSIRWVENGAQPQARLRGQARRERMRNAMKEVKTSFGNVNAVEREQEKERLSRIRSEVTGSWRSREKAAVEGDDATAKGDGNGRAASEGDKENRPVQDKASPEKTTEDEGLAGDKDVEMGEAGDAAMTAVEAEK